MIATNTTFAVAHGDGIGPEIMSSVLEIMKAAGVDLTPVPVDMGEKTYLSGVTSGIGDSTWDVLREHPVMLKAPVTTPQGGGFKSLNVTLRKSLSLFANVRPVRSYGPYIPSTGGDIDMVIIRENEEDLYAGIEHRQTEDVVQCLKLITRPGSERIIRYAFEYAKAHGRKRVTCMSKDNIMKQTDGLFHQVFREIGKEYPDIKQDHMIIDIGAAKIASHPQTFDVVVLPNLYGDIVSDIAAQVAGSVGLAGSANVGPRVTMFEAIHGSAPDIAGQGIANPSGLLQAACMMLDHLDLSDKAALIRNAWLRTIEDGIHTADIYRDGFSIRKVGTSDFTAAVIERLGQDPAHFHASVPVTESRINIPAYNRETSKKVLVGADIFVDWAGVDPEVIGTKLINLSGPDMKLKMITNRGVKVFPGGLSDTFCTDHWRCRFVRTDAVTTGEDRTYPEIGFETLLDLQARLSAGGIDIIKTENLYEFDGERGFSLGQGE